MPNSIQWSTGFDRTDFSDALATLCRSQKTSTPEGAIRGAIAQLLSANRLSEPPIPLRPLQRRLGVTINWRTAATSDSAAATLNSTVMGRYVVNLSAGHKHRNWRRARFTIAHELVHVLLYRLLTDTRQLQAIDATPDSYKVLERLCDLGAAELLMPSHHIRADMRSHGVTPSALLGMYDRYLVSRHTLLLRIAEVLPRATVSIWRNHARHPNEPALTRVVRCYPRYSRTEKRPWFPAGMTTKHVSEPLATALESGSGYAEFDNITIHAGAAREWIGKAVITDFAPRGSQGPLFEGMHVADELRWPNDSILVLCEPNTVKALAEV